jgi:hypothetical protein
MRGLNDFLTMLCEGAAGFVRWLRIRKSAPDVPSTEIALCGLAMRLLIKLPLGR